MAILVSALFIFNDAIRAQAASFIDIGLTVNQGTQASPDIQRAAIEDPAGAITSPLKLAKNGVVYSVALVDPSDPLALKVLIKLPSGVIKALRKFGAAPAPVPTFSDQFGHAIGHSNGTETNFYATFSIPNNSPYSAQFILTAQNRIHLEYIPGSFTIDPNDTSYTRNFGSVEAHGDPPVPDAIYGTDSSWVTYAVIVNGAVVDTVTYTWDYQW